MAQTWRGHELHLLVHLLYWIRISYIYIIIHVASQCSWTYTRIQFFENGYGLIPPVEKFSWEHSLRLIFSKGGVLHNHQRSGLYHSYSIYSLFLLQCINFAFWMGLLCNSTYNFVCVIFYVCILSHIRCIFINFCLTIFLSAICFSYIWFIGIIILLTVMASSIL